MNLDTQRLILLLVFSFSVLMLWDAWERHNRPKPAPQSAAQKAQQTVPTPSVPIAGKSPASAAPKAGAAAPPAPATPAAKGEVLRVRTDLMVAEIDSVGGTLREVELIAHRDADDASKRFILLGPKHHYSAQSGLTGEGGPNHRSPWRFEPGPRELSPGQDVLEVRLSAQGSDGVTVEKRYTFHRNSYIVDLSYVVKNTTGETIQPHAYFQLVRDDTPPAGQTAMMKTFTGPVFYTQETAYHKVDFSDVAKGKTNIPAQAKDGWIGMSQHYFVAAWLPPEGEPREFYARKLPDDLFAVGTIVGLGQVAAGGTGSTQMRLYVGPQEQFRLKAAAPGLDLVVDYGWLTIIAWPLFWLLQKLHGLVGNWGVAIILLTILIKLVFFPLSAASYKSMAKMKLVTPRLTKIREMYANDRQKMNQAMMELYKTEKINPLGGCFPILVQIPVFISLYWVLLAAIELRHAPFILWIKDLSALDPYYVLPILMAGTMILQTRMNPKPPDPVQAKVMQFMPYVFSVFFFFFPAGLVLYWLVNNCLSIAQQWQIQRMFDRDKTAHARR
jgi:YidC/Oxa1 family membrane protein insertase